MKTKAGTTIQSGLSFQESDYNHLKITHPVLGIVMNVYKSDDALNTSSTNTTTGRGSHAQARVLVVNDGSDSPWILDNVTITPSGSTGIDNYEEELPKGTSGTIDGAASINEVNYTRWDGDWCVVDFIGGNINSAFMITWWPHPSNRSDPSVTEETGRRFAKRFQGTKYVVTSKGSVLVDTQEANCPRTPQNTRKPEPTGGDIRISVKPEREFELNFNPFVQGDPNESEFLWNPHDQPKTRETSNTSLVLSKNAISAIAGEVVNIIAKRQDIILSTPNGKIYQGADADQQAVLGNELNTLINDLLTELSILQVSTALGPSGFPLNQSKFIQMKTKLSDHLSTFVYVKKDPA